MEHTELMRVAEATGCAVKRGGFVFLCDPKWGASERHQFERLAKAADKMAKQFEGWLCMSTGGTSGKLRFARHDEGTMSAAVRAFCRYFNMERVNVVDVLPVHHVSSFMARVRSAATGGVYLPYSWKEIEQRNFPEMEPQPDGWVVSLVPTQLQRLLTAGERALIWLHQFRIIFVGGGPVWAQLVDGAAEAQLPIVFSYGMTETAAMVTAQAEGDFGAGARSSGRVMPHARVELVDVDSGRIVTHGETGLVRISAESLFRGYFPEDRAGEFFQTEDLAFWDAQGGLNIVGRRDAVIITGGKKVMPGEVMDVLRASGVFNDVAVVGIPDAEWGQRVVACFPGRSDARLDMRRVESALHALAKYKWPKAYVPVADWPRNAQGKLNRSVLIAEAQKACA